MSAIPRPYRLDPLARRAAKEFAADLIAECVSSDSGPVDALDEASNRATCFARCPDTFRQAQRELVHSIVLKRFLNAIGRC